MKHYVVEAGYYKQGDDFEEHRVMAASVSEAFLLMAADLERSAASLRELAALLAKHPEINAQGDGHVVSLYNVPAAAEAALAKLEAIGVEEDEDEDD